jgi:hypothetical protein
MFFLQKKFRRKSFFFRKENTFALEKEKELDLLIQLNFLLDICLKYQAAGQSADTNF